MATDGAETTRIELDDVAREQAIRSTAAAHRPATVLSGPYGHPIHPLLVTVPIGAFVATLAFDVASLAIEGRAYGRPALWLSAIGIVSGLVAAAFGFIDYRRLTKGTRAHAVATRHMVLMDLVLVCFVIGFIVRRADPDQYLNGVPVAALVLSAVGVAILFVGGWLGGRLTYSYGVRVVDEADQLAAHVVEAGSGSRSDAPPTD